MIYSDNSWRSFPLYRAWCHFSHTRILWWRRQEALLSRGRGVKPHGRSSFPKPNQVIFRSEDENIYLFIFFFFYKWSNNSHFNTKMFHTLIMPFKHRRVTFLCGPASTAPHGENPINCSVIWSQKSKITSVGNFIFTGPGVSSATPPCKCTVHWVCGGEESKLWWVEEEERSKPITLICCWKQLKKL